ncbi:DUF3108 domain-containing protein [Methylobacterium oryzisoli]|uniref:DUF3108 domain-containing protein n=1 Tax=Methylobacterium oryzisoli TaxID=3385502 RepID=UPI003892C51D
MRATSLLPAFLASGLLLATGQADPAAAARARGGASANVTVDYGIILAGVPIGTAKVVGSLDGPRYRMDVSARLTGLAGAITGGYGSGRASGQVAPTGRPQPGTFAISSHSSSASITVRMALTRGNVVASEIAPPLLVDPERVPVNETNKRGIIDPVSALLMPAQGRGSLTDPENCNRVIPVFDGATRFDVVLSYGETRQVDKPGYAGPVLVCNARYRPIAGHRPDRPGVKFMEDNTDMSVWLAPVEGARVLLPLRIAVRTMLGTNIIEATRFDRGGPAGDTAQAVAQ